MSEARGTYVSIYLKDEATKHLQKIDKLVGEVERSFMNLGQEVDESTGDVDSLTKAVQKTGRELKDSADGADSLTNSLIKSEQNARDVQKASAKIETELEGSKKEAQSLTTQLTTAKTNMGALSKEANQVDVSLQGASSTASNLSGIIAGIGVGAAVTGLVASVSEFESAMGRIEAKTALTGAELASVQEAVNSVYTSGVGQDLTTVTDEVARIKTSLRGLDGEELVSFSKNAITMADLWGESTDNVTWAVKNMTSNFDGLSETEALDLLTVGFQRTGDYSQDLLDTFKEYSPYFSKMGLDAEEFTKILIAGAENGAWNMDKVGDSVKEFGILGMDGSKATAEGFAAIGLDADMMAQQIAKGGDSANQAFYATIAALSAMDDEVARNQAGVALFGTQWEDVREDVILAMGDAKNAVLDFDGAAAKATDAVTDNFGTDLLSTVREFKTEVAQMFSSGTGAEALASGLSLVEAGLDGALVGLQWIVDNGTTVTAIVAGVGASFVTLQVISTVKTLLDLYKASAFASTFATQGLNAALRANPIGMVVTLIGLLVSGGVLLYQNWDTVKVKAGELWGVVQEKFAGIKESVSNFIQPAIGWFDSLSGKWNDFKSAISNFKVPEWMSTIGGAISSGISKVKSWVGADGSHATGLANVGWDGYRAELHKGESVLTAAQSNTLRGMGILSANGDGTPNIDLSPLSAPVTPNVSYTPSTPAVSVTTNTKGNLGGSGAPIHVVNNFTINASGNDAGSIVETIKSVVPNLIRNTISDILDEELQTQ